jgi:hypothetical protein
MLTRSLTTLIKREASDWSRELITSLIDEVQLLMASKPLANFRILDPLTGRDPEFTTTNNTFSYNCDHTTISTIPSGTEALIVADVYDGDINGDDYDAYECSKFIGTQSDPAKFIFETNPGAVAVRVKCYKKPTSISSESIELEIPPHWHIPGVYEGVMGIIERTENGRSDRYMNWQENILPRFYYDMNRDLVSQSVKTYDGGY